MNNIRLRIAGIYVTNNQILLVKHQKYGKEYYLLPGGGQESGETAPQALEREWDEELGLKIKTGEFLFAGESVPPKSSGKRHVCQVVFNIKEILGNINFSPDGPLVGYHWCPIEDLDSLTIYPKCYDQIKSVLSGNSAEKYMVYQWED